MTPRALRQDHLPFKVTHPEVLEADRVRAKRYCDGRNVRFRSCAFCAEWGCSASLVKYAVRRYAHASCLVQAKGWPFVLALCEWTHVEAVGLLASAVFEAHPDLRVSLREALA